MSRRLRQGCARRRDVETLAPRPAFARKFRACNGSKNRKIGAKVALRQICPPRHRLHPHPTGPSGPTGQESDMRKFMVLAAAIAAFAGAGAANAAEIEVKMLNKGTDGGVMVFEPAFVKIEPGDSVKFVATDKGHNA